MRATSGRGAGSLPWRDLLRALAFMRPYAVPAMVALLSLFGVTAATLLSPQFVRLLIDRGVSGGDWNWVLLSTAGLLLAAVVRGVLSFLQGYLSEKASQGVAYDLRNLIFEKLQHLSFSYHDRAQTGQLMTRITSDVENVRGFTGQGFLTFVSATVTLFGTATILILVEWRLALVVIATVPLILAVLFGLIMKAFGRFRFIQQKLGHLNSLLQENLAGAAVVRAFAREPHERRRYEEANRDLLGENVAVIKVLSLSFPLVFFMANLGTLGVVWLGGELVMAGELTIGTLVAFNTYLSFLLMPVFQLGFIATQLSRSGVSAQRVFEIVDAQSEVTDLPGARRLGSVRGEVSFDRVSFRYAGQERNILDAISFTARPGEMIAVVGPTGSGKSTIINLIPRFYDVTEGAVRIDGGDVREVTLQSLRSQIGVVLQEATLFGGTIAENIAYGKPDATRDQIEEAARAAQAEEFICSLADGYDSVVGERGVTLSGGQRQRISIARTLLVDPRILLLDDATSSVDAATEQLIQRALEDLARGRTTFVIAQRLSTLRLADRILVLEDGRIVAEGRHEELLETSPLYCDIVAVQIEDGGPAEMRQLEGPPNEAGPAGPLRLDKGGGTA
jgi:ATP-binding cassette, subfamily B, multidrug efflux pump